MPNPTTHNPATEGDFDRSDTKTLSSGDEKLLKRLRERYTYMVKAHKYNRDMGNFDMQALYSAKGPWDPIEVAARVAAKRPCVHLPQLPQYPTTLVNQVRQNPQGVKVTPAGYGANDKTATLRGDRIRAIEQKSNAKQAYLTALQCAAERGYGVLTLECREISWDEWDQEIRIVREPDPNALLWDPDYREADASDIQDGFKLWRLPREEYKRRWPNAAVQDFKVEENEVAPDWCNKETQLIARYSYFDVKERYLYLVDDGSPKGKKIFEDELAPGWKAEADGWLRYEGSGGFKILKEKKAVEKKVKQCLTNGIEILDRNAWSGKRIPIFPMVGKEIWMEVDGRPQRITESYIRQAIDAQKAFNSAKTNEVESANMVPKATYMMYEGQQDTATDWENINKIPTPYALVKPIVDAATGAVLPLPQRSDFNPQIESMEIMAEAARRAMQAAIGSHGFTIMDDTNVKSGKAVNSLKKQTDTGSYHFVDGYETTIRSVGLEINELLDPVEDTARDVGLLKSDGTHEIVRINEPYTDKKTGQQIEHRYTPRNEAGEPLKEARHDVVIDSGRWGETKRDETRGFLEKLLESPMGPLIADILVQIEDLGPYTDELKERLIPTQFRKEEGEPDLPPAIKQQMGQLAQQNKELTQTVQQLLNERESKQQDLDSKAQIEQDKIASNERMKAAELEIEKLKIQAQVRIKEIDAMMKGVIVHEQLTTEENIHQSEVIAERQIAELSHDQSLEAQDVSHQQALEVQDRQTEADLAAQAQAAEATPEQPTA